MAFVAKKAKPPRIVERERAKPFPTLLSLDGALLVDVRGAARLAGVSPGSLYRMISAGTFPEGRPYPGISGKRQAWRVDDVAAWADEHFPRSVEDPGE